MYFVTSLTETTTAMKRTKSTRTRRAPRSVRFTTERMLKVIASFGRVAVAGEIASKLGDDSRDGRRKLSVMLNRAKKAGLVKHAPSGEHGNGSRGSWFITTGGRKVLNTAPRSR